MAATCAHRSHSRRHRQQCAIDRSPIGHAQPSHAQPNPVAFNSNMTITPASPGSASAPTYIPRLQLVEKCDIQSEWIRPNLCRRPCHQRFHRTGNRQPWRPCPAFFDGNMSLKARDIDNNTGLAANLQFYGHQPHRPRTTQTIDIAPPGDFTATFYAPSADFSVTGNPDMTGSVVAKNMTQVMVTRCFIMTVPWTA